VKFIPGSFHVNDLPLSQVSLCFSCCRALWVRAWPMRNFTPPIYTGLWTWQPKWLIRRETIRRWGAGFDDPVERLRTSTSLKSVFTTSRPEVVWYRLHGKGVPPRPAGHWQSGIPSSGLDISSRKAVLSFGEVAPFVPYTQKRQIVKRIPDQQIATATW